MEPKNLHILIVDDDPNQLRSMGDILKAKGFVPFPARNGAAALRQAAAQAIDVAMIDLQLEDMPGLELLRLIKTRFPGTECILLTGHASQSSAIDAINAGAYSYFQKPCEIDQLVLSIQRAGEKRAAEQAVRESEASLQAVLQSTADGILAISRENKVLYANRRFIELWHIPPDVMASQDDSVLLQYVLDQLVDPQGFLQKVQDLYQSDEESFDTLDFKDGRVFERLSCPLAQVGELRGRVWSFRDITERKRIEEKLVDERTLLRTLIDNLPDRVYVMDAQGRKIISNMADWQASGGKTMEDVIGKTDQDTYPPEMAEKFWDAGKKVIESGTPIINIEEPGYDAQGNLMSVLSSKVPLRDGLGKVTGLVGIGRDITERKRTEEALRESEERYRGLYENALVGIYRTTPDGRILMANPALVRMLGYESFDKLAQRNRDQAGYEPDYPRSQFLAAMEKDGEVTGMESPWKTRTGGTIIVRESAHVIRDANGQILYYDGMVEDITGRRQAEQALHASEARFGVIFEKANDAIHIENADDEILEVNSRMCEMMGYTREELLKMHVADLQAPEVRQSGHVLRNEIAQHGSAIFEGVNMHRDGRRIPVEISAGRIELPSGDLYISVVRDITERKRAEAERRNMEARLRALVEQVPAIVYTESAETRENLYISPQIEQLTGYSPAEWLENRFAWRKIIHPDDLAAVLEEDKRTDATGEPFRREYRVLTRDGRTIWFRDEAVLIKDQDGTPMFWQGIVNDISERKLAEEVLLQSEEHYRGAITAAGLVPYGIDYEKSCFTFIGEDILKLTGYPAGEFTPAILKESVLESHVLGTDNARITEEEAERRFMAGEIKKWGNDLRIRTRSGEERWISDVSVPLLDKNGKVTSAIGIFQDLTERKQAEERIRLSEERYRMLAENMTDTVWLMDLNLKTTYISPSVTRLRGYTLDELNTVPLDQQLAPESFMRFVKMFTTELSAERLARADGDFAATLELEMYKKDGTAFWSENTYSLIRDPKGQPLAILVSGREVTESKKAQAALENSEKRFRALIENNTDGVVLIDPRGQVLYESPAVARVTGHVIGLRLGQSSFEHVHPEDRQVVARILNELVRSPGRIAQANLRVQHKDGSWRWVEATATNLLGEHAVQAIVLNLHDFTARKQAEDALATTERIYRQAITRTGGVPYQRDYGSDNFVFLGEGIENLTGYTSEEMTGSLFNDRLRQIESYGEYKDLSHEERIRLARQGNVIKEWREDYLFEQKDGSLVWLADHSVQVMDPAGKPVGSLGILIDITERKRTEQNIRQRVNELEVLYETGLHISRMLEPKEIGRKVIETLAEKLSWKQASIRLYNPQTERLELLVFNRPGLDTQQLQAEMRRLNRAIAKPGQGFSGWVIQHGQSIRSGDVRHDPRFIRTFTGLQSGLYVPMQVGERTIGVIGVESEQAGAFTEADERLLKTLAAQAGVAIENARLLAETLRQVEELGALADISSALRTALTRTEIVTVILDQLMMGLFHSDDACLVAYDPVTSGNIIETTRGKWGNKQGLHLNPGEGLSGLVAETLQPYQSNDLRTEQRLTQVEFSDRPEALAGVPLLVQGQFIGSLWIGRSGKKKGASPVPFTSDEVRLLGSVADMAANALQRASMHEQALRHAEELLTINTMGRLLAETLDLHQIYEKLDEIVWQLLDDISILAIALYDEDRRQITYVWFNNDGRKLEAASLPPLPLESPGEGTQSQAVHTRQPVIINDLRERLEKSSFETNLGVAPGRVTQSGLYVPMLAHGRVVGVIQVESCSLNRFSQKEADLLSLVANTAAVAIQNARLFSETEKQLHNLAALHEIDTAISASVDIHVTLNILLEQTLSELHADAAAVLLLNPLARTLEYAASQGFRKHQVIGKFIPVGVGLVGQAALGRQIQSISDLRDVLPSRTDEKAVLSIYDGEEFVTHHAVPLNAKGQVQGVLEVFHRSPFQPDDEWLAFLETLSRQAAIAIDNNSLFDNLQRSNTNIIQAYDATIQGWSQALELRDKETEGHAQRVSERTVQLARLVGVPDGELEHVRRGTLLHDIGKMGVPDAILLKPGKLMPEEWAIMRRHPAFAYEMLSSIAYLRPALDIPHYHHERWDGTGYPEGLKGTQIPLYARIFAVVDVYDALTNDRPYRPAWTVEKSLEYIRAQSGKHFDPAIVEAFLNMLAREH